MPQSAGVTILMEALPHSQSDVVHTLAEAAEVVRQIGSPGVRNHVRHATTPRMKPNRMTNSIARYFDIIRHIHVNEMDGRHPGTGDYDFAGIFRVLHRLGYDRLDIARSVRFLIRRRKNRL